MNYQDFLATKRLTAKSIGIEIDKNLINQTLFPFQRDLVYWAIRKGRAALFCDTGLGKTFMQIEWARLISQRCLIIAPLSVAQQTIREAAKLDVTVTYVRSQVQVTGNGLYITNYEMIEHFDPREFDAVVLDESSILKSLDGKTRQLLTDMFADTLYKLCCTATPAPNDLKEVGQHAEFLGVMNRKDMLSCFFRYSQAGGMDRKEAWRLKSHAVGAFYEWLASWAMAVKKPSDIGYSDEGYILPQLTVTPIFVNKEFTPEGMLPGMGISGLSAIESKKLRRASIAERIEQTTALVNDSDVQWVLWCGLNEESDKLAQLIPNSVNVQGSMSIEDKVEALQGFQEGKYRVLITKCSIAGFGINMQNCHKTAFVGLDYSWESYYQAIRRFWRFGQTSDVDVFIILTNQEQTILDAIFHKEGEARKMTEELIKHSAEYSKAELQSMYMKEWKYAQAETQGNGWTMWLGDSAERMKEIPDESIDLSVYSPPFSDLFVYSATPHDLGNCATRQEFFEHYSYIIRENLRITKPGRLCCVHVQDARAYQNADNFIGLKDFSGDVIEAYKNEGWIFWQRITINKNPQTQAVRLKDHRLLFITLKKDSTGLSGGLPDYVLVFKKPGDNQVPVTPYTNGEMTEQDWIDWAHPVWNGIRETDVLPVIQAKSGDDEKHMCPLQLPVIERCVKLWSNPGELVFSPFGGIGSEGYVALKFNRRAHLIELKPEYYNVALRNLKNAESLGGMDMFQWLAMQQEKAE